ncbi:MAG TPA: ABC transporter substrate-binding protein [Sphingomicrobium sp.]|nr:ABC transporter substrate-binding protein [Sphingomicrobium sp.]
MTQVSRRSFNILAASLSLSLGLGGCAHHRLTTGRLPRVGYLTGDKFPTLVAAFRQEMRALGYVEGENIVLEMRQGRPNSSDGAAHVTELAAMDLDVIVVAALPYALELQRLKSHTPIVVATGPGLISNGLAHSMERPGGNVTGMDELPPGLTGKRLRLLKEAAPHLSRVALLSTTPGRGGHQVQLSDAESAAPALGLIVRPYRATNLAELQTALARLLDDGMEGFVSFQGGLALVNRDMIVDFARQNRLPAIYQSRLFVEAGGLMSYAPDQEEQFRIAARYVDKILKGAPAGDLPIMHPARYFLSINSAAATAIGLTFSPGLIGQADNVMRSS